MSLPPTNVEYTRRVAAALSLVTNASAKFCARTGAIERAGGGGEVGRLRRAADVGVAAGVDCNVGGLLVAVAAEERRVLHARVDDQLVVALVARRRRTRSPLSVTDDVAAGHRHLHATDGLVGERHGVLEHADRCRDLQPSGRAQAEVVGAVVGEADVGRAMRRAARGTRT